MFLKANFCIYKLKVHGRFLHIDIDVKEKPQNVHFERIHGPVFVTRVAF